MNEPSRDNAIEVDSLQLIKSQTSISSLDSSDDLSLSLSRGRRQPSIQSRAIKKYNNLI